MNSFIENRTLIVLVCVFVCGCNDSSINNCEQFQKMFEAEKNVLNHSRSLSILNNVLKNDSTCIDALLTRGDLFMEIDSFPAAKEDYRKAILTSSSNVYALYRLGMVYEFQEINDSASYYFNLALKEKEIDGAFIDYSNKLKGIESSKSKYDISTIELIYQNGIVSYYLRDIKTALKSFELCISEGYNLKQVYLYRGAALLEMGNLNDACENFHLAENSGNADASNYVNEYCK